MVGHQASRKKGGVSGKGRSFLRPPKTPVKAAPQTLCSPVPKLPQEGGIPGGRRRGSAGSTGLPGVKWRPPASREFYTQELHGRSDRSTGQLPKPTQNPARLPQKPQRK